MSALLFGHRVKIKDVVLKNEYVTAKVGLFRWNKKFDEAQKWLDKAIFEKARPIIPYKTGQFLGKIEAANSGNYGSGRIRMSVPPQGRYLYRGISRFSGRPLHYTNPRTVPYWGKFVIREYQHELKDGVEQILRRK